MLTLDHDFPQTGDTEEQFIFRFAHQRLGNRRQRINTIRCPQQQMGV
ncbi:hypothetical protein [Nitrosomonas sp.]